MIKALMVYVDGVLVRGRPDGRPWSAALEADLGVSTDDLHREFFAMYWEEIVVGRVSLMTHLPSVLQKIGPHLTAEQFIAYWFEQDSALDRTLLNEFAVVRSKGLRVYLATNQEHMRAAHLMSVLGLADHVDGIFYSAQLGCRKPSRAFFDTVSTQVGFAAGELLLVDDTLDNIRAAEAAGWRGLHWPAEDLMKTVLG